MLFLRERAEMTGSVRTLRHGCGPAIVWQVARCSIRHAADGRLVGYHVLRRMISDPAEVAGVVIDEMRHPVIVSRRQVARLDTWRASRLRTA